MAKVLAIANCRVSSDEQLQNGSLSRQQKAVLEAANDLGVVIPEDGWWSGSVSSKKGTNVSRKDLKEMVERCKKDKRIKYLIVDEPDRFMRSIDEAAFFEVTFRQLGVTVWYASDPELNKADLAAKLLKFTKYLTAEGSNDDRVRQSIDGQTDALNEGRYTFHPKAGYRKGYITGIPELHPERGPALRKVLKRIASGVVTPTNGLIELNASIYTKTRAPLKMDKFRIKATDPFNAGIIDMNKQVKVLNEHGLHEPLITVAEHRKLIEIFDNKPKYQIGPKRKGNPRFPLNNLMEDDSCSKLKNKGRVVGYVHSNGKYKKFYEKYRCRSCNRYWHKEDIHLKVMELFNRYKMPEDTQNKIISALEVVWIKDADNKVAEIDSIKSAINNLEKIIEQKVESATDYSNTAIKEDILKIIEKKKEEITRLNLQLESLTAADEHDKEQFMRFALGFIQNAGKHFLEPYITKEYRLMCKQMLFPAGIYINQAEKVYTPEISVFYRGGVTKKDAETSDIGQMVRVEGV